VPSLECPSSMKADLLRRRGTLKPSWQPPLARSRAETSPHAAGSEKRAARSGAKEEAALRGQLHPRLVLLEARETPGCTR
jgi:hypothetical protein